MKPSGTRAAALGETLSCCAALRWDVSRMLLLDSWRSGSASLHYHFLVGGPGYHFTTKSPHREEPTSYNSTLHSVGPDTWHLVEDHKTLSGAGLNQQPREMQCCGLDVSWGSCEEGLLSRLALLGDCGTTGKWDLRSWRCVAWEEVLCDFLSSQERAALKAWAWALSTSLLFGLPHELSCSWPCTGLGPGLHQAFCSF